MQTAVDYGVLPKVFSFAKLMAKPKSFSGNDSFHTFDSFIRKFNIFAKLATDEQKFELLPAYLDGLAGRYCEVLLDSDGLTYDI